MFGVLLVSVEENCTPLRTCWVFFCLAVVKQSMGYSKGKERFSEKKTWLSIVKHTLYVVKFNGNEIKIEIWIGCEIQQNSTQYHQSTVCCLLFFCGRWFPFNAWTFAGASICWNNIGIARLMIQVELQSNKTYQTDVNMRFSK